MDLGIPGTILGFHGWKEFHLMDAEKTRSRLHTATVVSTKCAQDPAVGFDWEQQR